MPCWFQEIKLGVSEKLLIRTDASNIIGVGHLMRCITLANEAHKKGWCICFVLRDPDDCVTNLIREAGHEVRILTTTNVQQTIKAKRLSHDDWLPVYQEVDASETLEIISDFKPDWIVVDHYALDATWHDAVKPNFGKIMVIGMSII